MEIQAEQTIEVPVTIDSSGRIPLPIEIRKRLGVTYGDSLIIVGDDDTFRIETADEALRRAQEYFASFVGDGVSLVDELLAERRQEAERE